MTIAIVPSGLRPTLRSKTCRKHGWRIAALIGVIVFGPVDVQAVQQPAPATLEAGVAALDAALEAKRRELKIPGMSVAVVQGDRTLLLKGYGSADVEAGRPVTPDTIFPIGSATKPMTAALLAMAVDQGRLRWTDHPRRHLSDFRLKDPAADGSVTIQHLLNHSSGLPRTDFAWLTGAVTRREAIKLAGSSEPTAKLGANWQYQNVMFAATGEIAGELDGSTWNGPWIGGCSVRCG